MSRQSAARVGYPPCITRRCSIPAMAKLAESARQREADLLKHPERLAVVEAALQSKIDRLRATCAQPKQ